MGKNSGTTRSGGSSNPKGAGERMNTYRDFKYSQRLNSMVENVEDIIGRLGNMSDNDTSNPFFNDGLAAINAYKTAATAAARGLRSGQEDAEDHIRDKIDDLRERLLAANEKAAKAAVNKLRSIVEKIVNDKESVSDREFSRAKGYTYNYSNGVVDIYRNGRRVAKGIRKNGKYDVKWF